MPGTPKITGTPAQLLLTGPALSKLLRVMLVLNDGSWQIG
jgi:hypothetical protein